MMPVDEALVRRKLAVIVRNIADLDHVRHESLTAYRRDRFRLKGAERLVQETIEAAVDANQHLLRNTRGSSATDYYDSFIALGRLGIMPDSLAASLAPAAGLRNRLVHEYDDIDDAIVLEAIGTVCDEFSKYVAAVDTFLQKALLT